jgi:DNA-nicking Smr family endonuclease
LREVVARALAAALGSCVLGFAPAPAHLGGAGAVLVLLKKA